MVSPQSTPRRSDAIVPACGLSRRMGQPKLLLPLAGRTVLACLLQSLRAGPVTSTVVVVRKNDVSLQQAARACGAEVVVPDVDPPDMATSLRHGLEYVRRQWQPVPTDRWWLIPADHPLVTPAVLRALWHAADAAESRAVAANARPPAVFLPTFQGTRGHPTLFAWDFADDVHALPLDCGLNWQIRRQPHRVCEVPVADESILQDLDTPADYQQLLAGRAHSSAHEVPP